MAVRRFNIKLGRIPVCVVGDAEMADESSSGGLSGVFPSKALSESDVNFYQGGTALQEWLNAPSDKVEYMLYDSGSLPAFDKDEETNTTYWKIIWKFPKPVSAKTLMLKLTNWDGYFYATNDATACFNAWDSWTYSEEKGESLLNGTYQNEWTDVELDASEKYQYFYLSCRLNGNGYLYETALVVE